MSIASKKNQERPVTATPENETSARRGTMYSGSPRKRRRLTAFAILILGLVLLVGLLPTILAHTPLVAYFVRRAAMLDGTIAIRSASIGWFSSASVSGIAICDAQNETVLEADRLTCDRSLVKLLFNFSNVGTLRIEKPRLSVKLTRDGSNVQSVLARWLTGQGSSSQGVDLSVEVVDGAATILDQDTQPIGYIRDLQCALDMSRQAAWPTRINATLTYQGNIYGFQAGPGELKVHLANGVLQADPLDMACNQGRVALQPELRMDRQPMEFRLSAGTLASHIQLDQAACRSALKYVVPVLASVTQSQGQFSIQLDGCRIPIGDLNRAEIAGRMIVHSATMSPGPLIEQLASLLAASPSLVRIQPESVIQFRMTGGRIYHQGLTLEFPNVTMRTYGSVGLDDSLKLMVETSVPLAWLPSNAVTDAIRKQKMQIPVGGTLKSPQIDLGELARVKNQLLGNLGVLRGELENQLNRFLQPKK